MTKQEISSVFAKSTLFYDYPIDFNTLSIKTCRSGQIIRDYEKGYASVGIIASGITDVYSVTLDGREIKLNTLRSGECFGISNLLLPNELETVLCCRTAAKLIFISKNALIDTMKGNLSFALRYATHCNQKIQFLIQRIELLTMQSCRGKLIEYLLTQKDENNIVMLDGTKEDLARHLGISRATLFREFALLTHHGLLKQARNIITIPDTSKLENFLYQAI